MYPGSLAGIFKTHICLVMFFTDPASQNLFCMIDDGEVASLLRGSSNHLKDFPVYHKISMLLLDVVSTNVNSPYPVSVEQLLKFDIFIM